MDFNFSHLILCVATFRREAPQCNETIIRIGPVTSFAIQKDTGLEMRQHHPHACAVLETIENKEVPFEAWVWGVFPPMTPSVCIAFASYSRLSH
jgi:hypothetical protein